MYIKHLGEVPTLAVVAFTLLCFCCVVVSSYTLYWQLRRDASRRSAEQACAAKDQKEEPVGDVVLKRARPTARRRKGNNEGKKDGVAVALASKES